MEISYKFTYLLMGLLFLAIWLILFFYRKDNRKEMLLASLVISTFGPVSNVIYIRDWWRPVTIWGPSVALVESFLVAFAIGGIMSVIYEDIFKKRIRVRKIRDKKTDNIRMFYLLMTLTLVGYFLSFVMHLNSFISINVAIICSILIVWSYRRDLIVESLISAFLMLLVAIIVYTGLDILTPGWIDQFWYWHNVPRIIILNVPLDDFINYLLVGALLGVIYEYWQEGRFVPLKLKKG